MTNLSPIEIFQQALLAEKKGHRTEALRLADAFSATAATQLLLSLCHMGKQDTPIWGPDWLLDETSPNSAPLLMIAPIQSLYISMKEWELAALKGADVCALAELLAPNTSATAGDYTTLADALENSGRQAQALEATQAAIRHLKGAGKWDKFAAGYEQRINRLESYSDPANTKPTSKNDTFPRNFLKGCANHIQKMRSYFSTQSVSPDDIFWRELHDLCISHVQGLIRYFDSNNAPFMDFARPRFELLIKDEVINEVIIAARQILRDHPNGLIMPVNIVIAGRWFIVLSVFPSEKDNDFLAACPNASFLTLAEQARSSFREIDDWPSMDFAHWILLLGKQNAASVHLHTHWSLAAHLEWLNKANDSKNISAAPLIMPVDLLSGNAGKASFKLFQKDVEVYNQRLNEK